MCIKCHAAMAEKEALKNFEYEPKELGPMEVMLSITHCGVCQSDVAFIDNSWGFSAYPLVPGHEIVGTISKIGSDVTQVKEGQRVGVGGQSGACGECEWCVSGNDQFCASPSYTGLTAYGGFGEKIVVDSRFVHVIPDAITSEQAAPLLCAGITTYVPLQKYTTPNSKVGIIGIGGLGHMAIQYAKAMGCEVTALSSSPGKETEAKQLGAHNFIDTNDSEQMEKAAGSLDLILSTVNVNLEWGIYLVMLRPKGIICILGVSDSIDIPGVPLVFGEKSVVSSLIGNRSDFKKMLEFSARHGIVPKTEALPMSKASEAVDRVRKDRLGHRLVLCN